MTIVLQNNAAHGIAVNTVQVSATYGMSDTPAVPVPGARTSMFSGTVSAGRSATATYSFLIPSADQRDVNLTVSYKSGAPTVLFRGAVR